eukprot:gb/GEZN01001943.1/.p1 GENE.gb/GEZN01001943.1/~~gb/GEZN01001943.1/.p1  ORF type:complete len:718 (-),score=109.17 gb/GEZN01001943.1/:461-2614(-)
MEPPTAGGAQRDLRAEAEKDVLLQAMMKMSDKSLKATNMYCVLKPKNLFFYEKEKHFPQNPKGAINLASAALVEKSYGAKDHGFQIIEIDFDEAKTFFFTPANKSVKSDWVAQLQKLIPPDYGDVPGRYLYMNKFSGFLNKAGGKSGNKGWSKRYFVLKPGQLVYYEKPIDHLPPENQKGWINLFGAAVESSTNEPKKHPHGFQITTHASRKLEESNKLTLPEPTTRARKSTTFSGFVEEKHADSRTFYLEPSYPHIQTKDEWINAINGGMTTKVFAVKFSTSCLRSDPQRLIPGPLRTVIRFINQNPTVAGLYKSKGDPHIVSQIIAEFDAQERPNFDEMFSEDEKVDGTHVHTAAQVLIEYFTSLPDSLFTDALAEDFEAAALLQVNQAVPRLIELIAMLPDANRTTLKLLSNHLALVAYYGKQNGTTTRSLSTRFPNSMANPLAFMIHFYAQIFEGHAMPNVAGADQSSTQPRATAPALSSLPHSSYATDRSQPRGSHMVHTDQAPSSQAATTKGSLPPTEKSMPGHLSPPGALGQRSSAPPEVHLDKSVSAATAFAASPQHTTPAKKNPNRPESIETSRSPSNGGTEPSTPLQSFLSSSGPPPTPTGILQQRRLNYDRKDDLPSTLAEVDEGDSDPESIPGSPEPTKPTSPLVPPMAHPTSPPTAAPPAPASATPPPSAPAAPPDAASPPSSPPLGAAPPPGPPPPSPAPPAP